MQSVLGIDYSELDYYEKAKALKRLREAAFDKNKENAELIEQADDLEEILRVKEVTPPFNLRPLDSFADSFEFNVRMNKYLSEMRKLADEKNAKAQ